MSDTKIFSFPEAGAGSSANSIAAMLPALLQNRGVDPAYLMGMMNNGNGFFGGNGGFQDIIALIVIAAIFGNGNGGGLFGGNNNGSREGQEMIMQTLNRNGVDISQLAQAVGCSKDQILAAINNVSNAICNQSAQMGQGFNQVLTAMLQGNNALAAQICECCCSIKGLVTEQGYQGQLRTIQQTNDIMQNATSNTNVLAAKIDAQTQIINDKFCQLEMREMQRENQNLRDQLRGYELSASQQQQTANIVAQLQPTPRPAYIVANPYGCGCNNFGIPFNNGCNGGCNNGCGC